METGSYLNRIALLRSSPLATPKGSGFQQRRLSSKGCPMKRNVRFALPLPSPRRIAYAWPLLVAAGTAHAATDWVDTHTKAFLTGPQLMARSAASPLELAAGETTDVVVSLKLRNADQLKQLARDVNRPGSARYRQYLTPSGSSPTTRRPKRRSSRSSTICAKSGFVNIEVAPNRLLVSARGTAGTVKTAFNTSLVRFQYAGHSGFANASTAQVPRALGDVVGSVLGLQNVARAHPMLRIGNGRSRRRSRPAPRPATIRRNSRACTTRPASDRSGVTVGIITIGGVSQTLRT
ncbi:protease pro-enzyme activation domain-containing protein [Burkholderia multivorans]|uniref:protease pro-enzyme activation domain-containing protein n=1 Tax=Burkholderia multivorans TaxID=87883 RepID=UPI00207CC88A|nr:protease pro-enzyme activation domain-containing protein [Burkholderia multivorans]